MGRQEIEMYSCCGDETLSTHPPTCCKVLETGMDCWCGPYFENRGYYNICITDVTSYAIGAKIILRRKKSKYMVYY